MTNQRFARVALAGRPNAGKSSLLNAMIGSPLAIVSPKAQASRHPVAGLLTVGESQLLLADLPGLLDPAYLLHHSMLELAAAELRQADVVVYLHPAPDAPAPALDTLVPGGVRLPASVVPVYTKADLVGTAERERLRAGAAVVSIADPASITALATTLAALAPVGAWQYPDDQLGTQPVRFFVGEYLREAAFDLLEDELPYAIAVEVDEFRETSRPVYIRATLFVERESQKGIVIGRGGAMLRAIGSHARVRLETLLGERVRLETWVKVWPHWRRRAAALGRLGFPIPHDGAK